MSGTAMSTVTASDPDVATNVHDRDTWFGALLLAGAAAAFVVALGREWIGANLDDYPPIATLNPVTGATTYGTAVYQLYLIAAPLMLGLGVAALRPGRHRAALRAATAGLAIAIGIGLVTLLTSSVAYAGSDVNSLVNTSPTALYGFYIALAVPVLALLSVLRPVAVAVRTTVAAGRGRVPLGLAGLSVAGYALALWLPWLTEPDGTRNRITDLLFGSAYTLVMALLIAATVAACLTGEPGWRLGALILAGCWTVIGLCIIAVPSWVEFGTKIADSGAKTDYQRAPGLYLGVLAIVLAAAAAWISAPHRTLGRVHWFAWLVGALFLVSLLAPWMSYPDLGRVGMLAGAGDSTIGVNVLYLVAAPLLLALATVASAGASRTAGWSAIGCAGALLAIEVAVIHWPRRFAYSEGREYFGTASIGAYAAVTMTVLAALAPWREQMRGTAARLLATAPRDRPSSGADHPAASPFASVRRWLARITLLGGAVAAVIALYSPWIHTRYIASDDAEFQGDILRSPLGFVLLGAGMLLLVTAGAVVFGSGGTAMRTGALTLAFGYVAVGVAVHAHAVMVGYYYQKFLIVGATYYWRSGWQVALVAGALTIAALAITPSRTTVRKVAPETPQESA